MWLLTLLNWWRDYQLQRLTLKQQPLIAPFTAMQQMVADLVKSQQTQNAILTEWMKGFQTTEVPKASVVREIDEWRDEQNRDNNKDRQEEWVPVDFGRMPTIDEMMADLDKEK